MPATLSAPGKTVLPPSTLSHFVLKTSNYSGLVDFYKTFLGASVAFADDTTTLLRYDDEHHRVGILNMPGHAQNQPLDNKENPGLMHVAFSYATLYDLALAWAQRKENDMLPGWCVNHGPTTSLYYRDPDGNMIETLCDNMDKGGASEFISSEEYKKNPFGTDFDMQALIERLEAGESEEMLKKRMEIGVRGLDSVPKF